MCNLREVISPSVEYDKFFILNLLSKSNFIFVFKSAEPLISLKKLVFKPNKEDISLISEKLNFPFVCNKLFIFVSFSSRFKLIVLPANSRSNREPSLIVAINPLFSTPLPRLISAVRFLIENFLVKLIEASDTFPVNS